MSNTEKVCIFTAAVRGFHYYQRTWKPVESQKLFCYFEHGNPFDRFAIKIVTEGDQIVGHLPRELSRVTKFLIERGAALYLTLTSTNYRRSPLVQGGLEIACQVNVKMPGTIKNHMIMDRYIDLVKHRYTEPKNETIMGSFLTRAVPEPIALDRPKKKRKNTGETVASRDIRVMFSSQKNEPKGKNKVIVLE